MHARRTQAGQATSEYLVGLGAVVIILLADPSPVLALLNAFKQFWTNFSYLLSLP